MAFEYIELAERARAVLTAAGLVLRDEIDLTGELAMCGTVKKPNGTDGRYAVHLDFPPNVYVVNYHDGGEGRTVPLYDRGALDAMTAEEMEAMRERIRQEKEAAQAKREEERRAAAEKANRIFQTLPPAGKDNPYLKLKGVLPRGDMRQDKEGRLVLPVLNKDGRLTSLQYIDGEGSKRFLKGGGKVGCFFPVPAKDGGQDGPLLIGEGCATVASACMATGYAGLVAFDSGNLEAVAKMARSKYPDREIVLLADNDCTDKDGNPRPDDKNPGLVAATAAAQAVGGKLAVCPAIRGHSADFNDLFTDDPENGPERVRVVIEKAREGKAQTLPEDEPPLPLRRPVKEQEPYPTKSFLDFEQALVDVANGLNVPVSMVGNSMLGVLDLLTQSIANVKTRRFSATPLSLYLMSVAESGDGKSETESVFMKPIERHEREQKEAYDKAYKDYLAERAAYERELDRLKRKKQSREVYRDELKELMKEEPKAPLTPIFTIGDTNIEGLYRFLAESKPHVGLFTDEGARLFGGTAFSQDNAQKTVGALTAVWSGKALDKMRYGDGTTKLFDRRVCSNIMMQPIIAEKLFADALLSGQGYLCRQLITWPAPMMKSSSQVAVENLPSLKVYYEACERLLSVPLQKDPGTGGIIFDEMTLSDEAHAEYDRFFDYIEEARQPENEYAPVNGYAKRAAEQALRIAGVLTLAHDTACRVISLKHMVSGIKLSEWYLGEILRITLDDMTSPEIRNAENLLHWYVSRKIETTSLRQVMRNGPLALRTKKEAKAAIDMLVDHGWLVSIPGGADVWEDGENTRRVKAAWKVRLAYAVQD